MPDVCVTGGQGDTDQVWCELAATPEEILWNWTHWSHMQRTRRTAVDDTWRPKMQGTRPTAVDDAWRDTMQGTDRFGQLVDSGIASRVG